MVALYTDDKLLTPTRYDHDRAAATTVPPIPPIYTSQASPTRAKRAPLTSKSSNDNVRPPSTTFEIVKGKKGKSKQLGDDWGGKGFFVDEENKKPSKTAAPTKKKSAKKERFDGVELSVLRASRRASTVIEIIEELSATSLTDITVAPDHQGDLKRLVKAATIPEIQDFSAFLTSPAVISLLDHAQQAHGPTFRKIGEASYSEVFAMSIKEDKELVVKVIPLFDPAAVVPPSTDASDKRGSLPDTSHASDVLRELNITSRMCELQGGGFIEFLGSVSASSRLLTCQRRRKLTAQVVCGQREVSQRSSRRMVDLQTNTRIG